MKNFIRLSALLLLICLFSSAGLYAQKKKKRKPAESTVSSQPKKSKDGLKPYKSLITKEAISDEGLFSVHRVKEKLYYEIPKSMLNKDMLWVTRIAKLPADFGGNFFNAGTKVNTQVIQWQKRNMKIDVRVLSFNNVSDSTDAIAESVRSNNFEPILYSASIKAISPDSSAYLVDVSSLFNTDIPAISGLVPIVRQNYKVRRFDKERSYIESSNSYPQNIEIKHVTTFTAAEPPSNGLTQTISLLMNQSMILLPEEKMQPRLSDNRVGWFTYSQIDYSSDELKSDRKSFIRRWKLVPKDIEAYKRGELVEPIKPIVYYLDPATPMKWRPYFKQGIEDWNKAFEIAGFKNAIIAKDPPSKEEDPEFSPEDVRYSVVRYVASTTRNAVGPSVSDPRTGEIIESDIIWYHNHLRSYRNRFMIEAGAQNPDARTLNTPIEDIGEMMRMVIAHEIGHALGLPHNMGASSAYPTDSLRSVAFTRKMGLTPSIMDYARVNYVAQPEDGEVRFIRMLGPYDLYAINWGYRYIPEANSPLDEKPVLDQWIKEKSDDPVYRFIGGSSRFDPRANTESLGDDNIKASKYAIENLKKVVPKLKEWTSKNGEGYEELAEIYRELTGYWAGYHRHVVANLGGIYENIKTADQEGNIFKPVPANVQKEAMNYLLSEALATPEWLLHDDIVRNISHAGTVERIRGLQAFTLNQVLDFGRMQRMIETEILEDGDTYTLLEMMSDLRNGIFREIARGQKTDPIRRILQRGYIERMKYLMTENPSTRDLRRGQTGVLVAQSDIRAIVRGELNRLQSLLKGKVNQSDKLNRYHIQDLIERIDNILNSDD